MREVQRARSTFEPRAATNAARAPAGRRQGSGRGWGAGARGTREHSPGTPGFLLGFPRFHGCPPPTCFSEDRDEGERRVAQEQWIRHQPLLVLHSQRLLEDGRRRQGAPANHSERQQVRENVPVSQQQAQHVVRRGRARAVRRLARGASGRRRITLPPQCTRYGGGGWHPCCLGGRTHVVGKSIVRNASPTIGRRQYLGKPGELISSGSVPPRARKVQRASGCAGVAAGRGLCSPEHAGDAVHIDAIAH